MSSSYAGSDSSSSSRYQWDEPREARDDPEPESQPKYTLSSLKTFLARKKFYIREQFVSEDDTVIFLKVHCESIGEDILLYFPSKYNVPREIGGIPSTEIIPYDLSDKDLLSLQQAEEKETRENYTELQVDDLKDKDSFSDDNYKPIAIDSNREYVIRKAMVRYINQLNKFKNCTAHIKYKFAILTNETLCVINRYNDTECYLVKEGSHNLVHNIIDSKTDSIVPIGHELYIMIDLPSFYEKINNIPDDIIKVHRNFYATLNRAHTKQTALAEHRFKNYQVVVARMLTEYTSNTKYLNLMSSLTTSLEKSVEQEEQILQKIKVITSQDSKTMTKDTEKSFKISKTEAELLKIREVKTKTAKLLHELKKRYHSFLLTFDSSITETCSNLKQVEESIARLGINLDKVKKG